ncbi:MAG: hypothetical protein AAGF96_18855 [Bacteroidota bacterium]
MSQTANITKKAKDVAGQAAGYVRANPMTWVYLVAGSLGLYFLYKVATAAGDAADILKTDPNAGGNNPNIDNPTGTISGSRITNTQAQNAASVLLDAMHTWGKVNDSEFERIKNILRGKNANDFALISEKFGKPRRSIFTGEGSVLLLGGEALSLSQWLSSELRPEQRNELRAITTGIF